MCTVNDTASKDVLNAAGFEIKLHKKYMNHINFKSKSIKKKKNIPRLAQKLHVAKKGQDMFFTVKAWTLETRSNERCILNHPHKTC